MAFTTQQGLPNFDTASGLLNQGFESFPDSVAANRVRSITYAEVDTLSAKIANQLIQMTLRSASKERFTPQFSRDIDCNRGRYPRWRCLGADQSTELTQRQLGCTRTVW